MPAKKGKAHRAHALVALKRADARRLVELPDGSIRISEYLFHRQGLPLGDFKRSWEAARVKAGLAARVADPNAKSGTRLASKVTFHDLRRTAVLPRPSRRAPGRGEEHHRPPDRQRV
jgi:hypothetical protein